MKAYQRLSRSEMTAEECDSYLDSLIELYQRPRYVRRCAMPDVFGKASEIGESANAYEFVDAGPDRSITKRLIAAVQYRFHLHRLERK